MKDARIKVISEIETDDNTVSVKPPFRLFKEQNRRYIRLEISSPVNCTVLKNRAGRFWPACDGPAIEGSILNLSAGGMLIVSDMALEEGTIVLLKMSLQDIEVLDNIVGLVKRADLDDNEWLMGIEFVSREYLGDIFSDAELNVLPQKVVSFDEQIKTTLNKYIYRARVGKREA
jgi:hypothetical protein